MLSRDPSQRRRSTRFRQRSRRTPTLEAPWTCSLLGPRSWILPTRAGAKAEALLTCPKNLQIEVNCLRPFLKLDQNGKIKRFKGWLWASELQLGNDMFHFRARVCLPCLFGATEPTRSQGPSVALRIEHFKPAVLSPANRNVYKLVNIDRGMLQLTRFRDSKALTSIFESALPYAGPRPQVLAAEQASTRQNNTTASCPLPAGARGHQFHTT